MAIQYRINAPVTVDQFIELLRQSTLGDRRPIDDRTCMAGMVEHGNLAISAWVGQDLIGIARSVTDFHYACYVSDLAVHQQWQRQGIGQKLLALTQDQLGPRCAMMLIAAPAANSYYQHLGFKANSRCWVLDRQQRVGQ